MAFDSDQEFWIVSRQNTFVTGTLGGTVLRAGGRQFNIPADSVTEQEIRDALRVLAVPRHSADEDMCGLSPRAVKLLLAAGSLFRGALPTQSPVATYLVRNYPDPADVDALLRSRRPLIAPDSKRVSQDLRVVMDELLPPAVPGAAGPVMVLVEDDSAIDDRALENAYYVLACPSWRSPGEILIVASSRLADLQYFRDASASPELAREALRRPHVSRIVSLYLLLMWIDMLSVAPRLPRAYAVRPELEVLPLRLEQPPICSELVTGESMDAPAGLSVHETVDALMRHRNDSASVLIEPSFLANGKRVDIRLAIPHASVTASGQGADLGESLLAAVSAAFAELGATLGTDVKLMPVGESPIHEYWPVHALSSAGLFLAPTPRETAHAQN